MKISRKSAFILLAIGLLSACGGGGEKSVFERFSKEYSCYNALGQFTERARFTFSEESATLISGGTPFVTDRVRPAGGDPNSYGYARVQASGQALAIILKPSGFALGGASYPVSMALTYRFSTEPNPLTARFCN
jgi:hypothetical protein